MNSVEPIPTLAQPQGGAEPSMFRQLIKLAIPSIASSISLTMMHFINNYMISRLDAALPPEEQLNMGAAMNGGMSAWVPVMAAFGVGTAVNTMSSQSLGRGEKQEAGAYAWQGLWFAAISFLFFWPLAMLGPWFFAHAQHEAKLVAVESHYFQILVMAAPITLASGVLNNFFLGIHRPINQMIAGIVGNIVDASLAYCLIFGNFGFPRMGVTGAAISAICGITTGLLVMLSIFFWPTVGRDFGTYAHWRPDFKRMWRVLRLGIPAGLQQGSDILSWTMFSVVIIGSLGTMYSMAQSTVMQYLFVSFMPAVGMGVAVNAMVGRKIGEHRFDQAKAAARTGQKITMCYMGSCGLMFLLFRHQLAGFFLQDSAAAEVAAGLLILAAVFQLADACNVVFISALRGAGDVNRPTTVMMTMAWTICVGGGLLIKHVAPGLHALGPWIMATTYIVLVACYVMVRWHSNQWQKLDVFGKHLKEHEGK